MRELIFLKLGGSLITDKNSRETPRLDVLARLAREIQAARAGRLDRSLLLGHGSGSFGHFTASEYGTRQGIVPGQEARGWHGYAATGAAASRLNHLVRQALLDAGLPAVTFSPSATARCRTGTLQQMDVKTLALALARGLLPIVHGDVALDETQGCTIVSTEQVFAYLARQLPPTHILLAGTVDGVYTADPLREPAARRLELIHADDTPDDTAGLGGSHGVDVTGGMRTKVREMAALVRQTPGLRVQLLSGEQPGALQAALLGQGDALGTWIVP